MPTVIGINQVPQGFPRPTFHDYYGQLYGTAGRQITDALLQALLGGGGGGRFGQVPTTPTPTNPGQLTFPSGATTRTSPLEMQQLQALGGVPSRQGDIVPFGQPSLGGVSYAPPTKLGIRPDLTYQLNQAKLQEMQQNLDPNSPINRYLSGLAAQANRAANQPAGDQGSAGGSFADQLRGLRELSDAGDEKATQRLRLILQLLRES